MNHAADALPSTVLYIGGLFASRVCLITTAQPGTDGFRAVYRGVCV